MMKHLLMLPNQPWETSQNARLAKEALQQGQLLVVPTETLYGLAVDPFNATALQRLIALKTRASNKPIPLIASDIAACERVAVIAPHIKPLLEHFWPGPLTVVLPARQTLPKPLLNTDNSIAIRVSSCAVARSLAQAAGGLITSTSANLAGETPPCEIAQLADDLLAQIDLLLDAGSLPGGKPSTIIAWRENRMELLRDGAIAWPTLCQFVDNEIS